MKKPDKHEFVEEKKIDGKLYKSVNEQMYIDAMKKYIEYTNDVSRHKINLV